MSKAEQDAQKGGRGDICGSSTKTAASSTCSSDTEKSILAAFDKFIPSLRGYATLLLGSVWEADDLVQETLLRAWRYRGTYQPNTNMRAWLFRILRNEFLTWTGRPRLLQDVDGRLSEQLVSADDQEWSMHYKDVLAALQQLTPLSREALALMAAGNTYEEIAAVCGCSLGTVKSRISRARSTLTELVEGPGASGATSHAYAEHAA